MTEDAFGEEEFGGARLGDVRREKRLVEMAAQAALTPGGKITEVFAGSGAEREAAFRLVENKAVDPRTIIAAAARAGFERVRGEPFVFLPVDPTSLTLSGVPNDSEMGPIGNRWSRELGAHVTNCIIVSQHGVTMGSAGQVYWVRDRQEQKGRAGTYGAGKKLSRKIKPINRPIGEKETAHWGTVIENAIESAREAKFLGQLWFQLDAGADFAHLLASASLLSCWVTVRTKNDRRIFEEDCLLNETVLKSAPLGTYNLDVPETNNRPGRRATLEVRYAPVVLNIRPRGERGAQLPVPLFAVHAREISPVPRGAAPLDWLLLTNRPGATLDDALKVIGGYTTRWRIEEVHKAWKSVTKVEESSLETLHAFSIWAAVLFSVAIRIERLKYFARAHPEQSAIVELSNEEVKTLCALRNRRADAATLTISVAVRWIADMGGYMNPHQGPPGSIVLARGLRNLRNVVDARRLKL